MADETSKDAQALQAARERFTRARASIGDMYGELDEIIKEYKRDEVLSSVESFNEFRRFSRSRLEAVYDIANKVLNGSLN